VISDEWDGEATRRFRFSLTTVCCLLSADCCLQGNQIMYKINVSTSFSGAHSLKDYPGLCKNLHGHNWKVRVQIATESLDELGMAIDFHILKDHLARLIDKIDHQHLNALADFSQQNPTSENIARLIFTQMETSLLDTPVTVTEVEIWESESSSTIYSK